MLRCERAAGLVASLMGGREFAQVVAAGPHGFEVVGGGAEGVGPGQRLVDGALAEMADEVVGGEARGAVATVGTMACATWFRRFPR